jgi:hypothetical protein
MVRATDQNGSSDWDRFFRRLWNWETGNGHLTEYGVKSIH